MSEIYSLKLTPKSGWATPLQADTIFGHLCWQIKQSEGEEVLEKFLAAMEKSPIFTLSNGFPFDYIPRPILADDFIKECVGDKTKMGEEFDAIKDFSKKTRLIKINELSGYQNSFGADGNAKIARMKKLNEAVKDMPAIKNGRGFHAAINRFSSTTDDEEHAPFAVPCQYLDAKDGDGSLWILIKVFDESLLKEYQIKDRLKQVFEGGYGKKKSVGLGCFDADDWKEVKFCENENGTNIVLLSNFVPADGDPYQGMYDIFVKYGKLGEERSIAGGQNFYKKPIVMIKECASFNEAREYVGRMIKDICADTKVVHYGYGFALKF